MGLDFFPVSTGGMRSGFAHKTLESQFHFFPCSLQRCILHYRGPLGPDCHQRQRKEIQMNKLSLQNRIIRSRGFASYFILVVEILAGLLSLFLLTVLLEPVTVFVNFSSLFLLSNEMLIFWRASEVHDGQFIVRQHDELMN
ncbi:hypothetical protein AVEN_234954-1 [Araneus ventricosus]|uniref:Uncharacterized protein n=1 Tax=Araneus ventricosus TaxID=182803 RepID=A0A4Y2FPG2_ARAVE|nr:hypothetical protein AVEN_234954-1 [Araneus ventricosus]